METTKKENDGSPQLWGVYFEGMDEWNAVESEAIAKERATKLNDFVSKAVEKSGGGRNSPCCSVYAMEWPFSPKEHALDLAKR